MQPTKGDIVLYTDVFDYDTSETPNVHPAVVTKAHADGTLDLCVFFMTGQFHKTKVPQGSETSGLPARGTWQPK